LGFSASFGNRFGEVREQNRKPQPRRNSEIEAGHAGVPDEIPHEEDRGRCGANFDDEHDWIASLPTRIQLLERIYERARNYRSVEERKRFGAPLQSSLAKHQYVFP
jgi:hypothetical protein